MIQNDPQHLSKVVKQIFDTNDGFNVDFYDVAAHYKVEDDRQGLYDHVSSYLQAHLDKSDDVLLKRIAAISFSTDFIHKLANRYWREV